MILLLASLTGIANEYGVRERNRPMDRQQRDCGRVRIQVVGKELHAAREGLRARTMMDHRCPIQILHDCTPPRDPPPGSIPKILPGRIRDTAYSTPAMPVSMR